MIRITVPALPVRNLKGVGKTSGKPYDMFQPTRPHGARPRTYNSLSRKPSEC